MKNIDQKTIIICLVFLFYFFGCQAQGDTVSSDTSFVCSISIFEKGSKASTNNFPEVYPNISNLFFSAENNQKDSIMCIYDFPFLKLPRSSFVKLKKIKNPILHLYYDCINAKVNNRYRISIPIKFSFEYEGAKFIVIDHLKNKLFYGMQKWGSTIYIGNDKLESALIY